MLDLLKIRKKTGRHKTLAAGAEPALPHAAPLPAAATPAAKKPDPAARRKLPAAPPREAKTGTQVKRPADPARLAPAESPAPPQAAPPARPGAPSPEDRPAPLVGRAAAFEPPPTRRKTAAEPPETATAPAPAEAALAEAKTADNASLRHLLCRVHQETFAVPISDILEILRERTLTPLPLTARALAGILSLRGRMVPVVDAALRLGFTPFPSDENCRIVVFEIGEEWIGLRVAAVGQVTVIDPEAVQQSAAALGEGRSELTSGVLRIGTQFVTVPVLQQLLDVNP